MQGINTVRENYMAADPEMYRDERPVGFSPALSAPFQGGDQNQKARIMMVQLDPLLRSLPYEQRTALLLNLLVTYAAEEPAALERRGKFINAMVDEFKQRLQTYLPLKVD